MMLVMLVVVVVCGWMVMAVVMMVVMIAGGRGGVDDVGDVGGAGWRPWWGRLVWLLLLWRCIGTGACCIQVFAMLRCCYVSMLAKVVVVAMC